MQKINSWRVALKMMAVALLSIVVTLFIAVTIFFIWFVLMFDMSGFG